MRERAAFVLAALALFCCAAAAPGQERETVLAAEGVVLLVLDDPGAALTIGSSPDGEIHLETRAGPGAASRVRIERTGERVRVFAAPVRPEGRTGSGSVARPGHSGRVVIRETEAASRASAEPPPEGPALGLLVPPGLALEGRVGADVRAKVGFSSVRLALSGRCEIIFTGSMTRAARIRAGGSSRLRLDGLDNATVELDLDGGAKAFLEGSFESVKVRAAAGARFETKGFVAGNYAVELSGAATGRHSGRIAGKCREELKGVSSFSTFGGL